MQNRCSQAVRRLAIFTLSCAFAGPAYTQTFYKGGTCIIASWTENTAAVIADTREISATSSNPRSFDNQISTKSVASKMHLYGGTMLVTLDGIASMNRIYLHPAQKIVYWDGQFEAAKIFSTLNVHPSQEEIFAGLSKWAATLQEQLSAGHIDPPVPETGKDLVTLQVFVRTSDTGFGVFIARFGNKGGKIAVTTMGRARNAELGETRFIPFGSCALHLGSDTPKSELSNSEISKYLALRKQVRHAKTSKDLALIDLELERLAVQISRRLATKSEPQRVDGPFDLATLDTSGRWTVEGKAK